MKILMLTPDWNLPWIKDLPERLRERGHSVSVRQQPPEHMKYDVAVHMWGIGTKPGDYAKRNVMFFRSYDFYYNKLSKVDWDKIDHVVNINGFMFDVVKKFVKHDHSFIPNYIDNSKFTFKHRGHGKNIGMACHIHPKKNLPLALQILMKLPEDYELHIAGEMQEPDIPIYMDEVASANRRRVIFYDHIPSDQMDLWWEDKNYCLSTSVREGCPNNVIEAMSKGIKPIVHGWPGASDLFDDVFYTVDQAVEMINGDYDSEGYRKTAVNKFGNDTMRKIIQVITGGGE